MLRANTQLTGFIEELNNLTLRKTDELVLIGTLAEMASVAPSAIRFYEKEGLLQPKKLGRLRAYTTSDATTLRLIVRLRKTGLPIAQVREALSYLKPAITSEQAEALAKIIQKQVEDLLRTSEIVMEQINSATHLLQELNTSKKFENS
jgi:DNA-binding transcriptional MerR regulator